MTNFLTSITEAWANYNPLILLIIVVAASTLANALLPSFFRIILPKKFRRRINFKPYKLTDSLVTPTELKFFKVLQVVVGSKYLIMSKVRLSDIFLVRNNRSALNRVNQKHLDFLLCDPVTLAPVIGIELDDKSHNRSDRRARDHFVDQLYLNAGLPLLHVKVASSYNPENLAKRIKTALIAATNQS